MPPENHSRGDRGIICLSIGILTLENDRSFDGNASEEALGLGIAVPVIKSQHPGSELPAQQAMTHMAASLPFELSAPEASPFLPKGPRATVIFPPSVREPEAMNWL